MCAGTLVHHEQTLKDRVSGLGYWRAPGDQLRDGQAQRRVRAYVPAGRHRGGAWQMSLKTSVNTF